MIKVLAVFALLTFGVIMSMKISARRRIVNDLSWGTKAKLLNDIKAKPRNVGVEYLKFSEDYNTNAPNEPSQDDNSMKIKLFRLMYETVRDSDLKVRRAEVIKTYYSNASVFELGYIIGDLYDKFNVMTDIGKTLERQYNEWQPMEHINAYEQIANKGIEIGHLVDLLKVTAKKNTSM